MKKLLSILCMFCCLFGQIENAQSAAWITNSDCQSERNKLKKLGITDADVALFDYSGMINSDDSTSESLRMMGESLSTLKESPGDAAGFEFTTCQLFLAANRIDARKQLTKQVTVHYEADKKKPINFASPPSLINSNKTGVAATVVPPKVVQKPPPAIKKNKTAPRNDSGCITIEQRSLVNKCTFTVDVGFCVENPKQTRNFFDSSEAFRCPNGGLTALGPGSREGNILNGRVHWFACNIKYRGGGAWSYIEGSGYQGICTKG